LITDHPITVGAGGNVTLTQALGGTITVTVGGVTKTVFTSSILTAGGTATGTATIAPTPVTIPAQNITLNLPREVPARVTVTRTVDASAKIDQIADLRSKFGFANTFLGPNWLFYFTGGASVGHFQRSLTLTQTIDAIAPRTFSSTTGDTRLGWVVGAGFDWKMTPNVLLGVLYRHHEFPRSTISFADDTAGSRSFGFGTAREHVDSVQGRLSWLFPIQ
jgi:opacity protein-like surface antigen